MSTYQMPQFPEPFWRDMDLPIFNKMIEDKEFDVAIVGGGITGITTGYLLVKEGVKVAIIEAGRILNGTTGHTTAKVTAQHGLIYDEFISHLGEEKAKLYYEGATDALNFIRNTVKEHGIDCDFEEQDAYVYSISEKDANKVEKEARAYQKLGIDGGLVDSIPFNIDTRSTIVMRNQAQYHPLKYLNHLVRMFLEAGGEIYENTTAVDIEDGPRPKVMLRNGKEISCKHLIAASHFPFCDKKGLYFARMYVERSYILGITTDKEYPGGMYISSDSPTRSLRSTPLENGERLILVSGEGHKTGQGIDTMKHYTALEQYAQDIFGIKEYKYRWSAQDMYTLDKVPYIGPITENQRNVSIATGYHKWGMTNGTAAALLLADDVLERDNKYRELYHPSRFHADPDVKKFLSINADVAKHFVKGKLEFIPKEPSDLQNDEGAVVMVHGQRCGAYKDQDGQLHVVDSTCTHLGCEVEWNHGDRTWDCPCHGSRFSYKGEVVDGPAVNPLKKVDLD
ncbi:FAD-dependent oxidoreductase [Cytobacillus sp. FJAT-54145]|uniref:FAD-dependent oxidoreductase n=1 Tax=Cytobacillus spartinae TaxID=3299023 RepID=A0ABW6KB70_9BACI